MIYFLIVLVGVTALPLDDLVSSPPGMLNVVIYSGYLNTATPDRYLHYVFVQANVTDPQNAPLALWLNGGPGCSSLMGVLNKIGPYIVGDDYNLGDMLTKNEYSWANAANMLYIESPAIVGFSTDTNLRYQWTDEEVAKDSFAALKDFLFNKAPEFSERALFITGASYAGKYVPDLANLVLENNRNSAKYINIKGIMVGNGVMNFENNQFFKSQTQYMIGHAMISDRLESVYRLACSRDYDSPRCKFTRYEFDIIQAYINKYNIYEICHTKSSTVGHRLLQLIASKNTQKQEGFLKHKDRAIIGEIPDCPQDKGLIRYWNLNKIPYKVDKKVNKTWTLCANLNYSFTLRGSMDEYSKIFLNNGIRTWLFSGDFDDQVPFTDTEKNVEKFNLEKAGSWTSWSVRDQHGGFYQMYDRNLTVITVKGAGHMVPQTQPKAAYQLFYNFVNSKSPNNQIY